MCEKEEWISRKMIQEPADRLAQVASSHRKQLVQDECIYVKGPVCHHVHVGIKHSVHLVGAGMTLRQFLVQYPSVTDCSSASSAGVSAVNLAARHGSTKTWVSNLL